MKQFETSKVKQELPLHIRNIIWLMIENTETPDVCSVSNFCLSNFITDGKLYQRILHAHENPAYEKTFSFECQNAVSAFVTVESFGICSVMYF